ncbi:MAG: ACT domain-containing protein [Nodosilinea sp.]
MPPTDNPSGERDLATLLRTMNPVLQPEEYVFCTLSTSQWLALGQNPLGLFQEAEGTTVILLKQQAAEAKLPVDPAWRLITLEVHSDLQAVGFLAAVAQALARAKISVNAVSAYFHDHLFVPSNQAEAALACLRELSSTA